MSQQTYVPNPEDPEFDEDFDDGGIDEDDEEQFDCGMTFDLHGNPTGCHLGGSEQCDFECPYREEFEKECSDEEP